MKRKIKFRAWNIELNRWATESDFKKEGLFINYDIRGNGEFELQADCPMWGHGRFEIVQFTGLKDKNDIEIFEGDIVRWVVDVDEDDRVIDELVYYGGGAFYPVCIMPGYEYEIIGNIFENPKAP